MNIVTPSNKNIHEITALDDTAFFDVLVPDYTNINPCNYYTQKVLKDKIWLSKSFNF